VLLLHVYPEGVYPKLIEGKDSFARQAGAWPFEKVAMLLFCLHAFAPAARQTKYPAFRM
jgi:hypothetical protein